MKAIAAYIVALVVAFGAARASAQDWTITTADFHAQPTMLNGLSSDGVQIISAGQLRTIPLDKFVSIQRNNAAQMSPAKFTVLLAGGDRLTGEPGKITGEQLLWESPSLGEVPIPLRRVVALTQGSSASAPGESPKQDMVLLANGDTIMCVVTDASASKVTVQTDNGINEVPTNSVTKIDFAATATTQPVPQHGYLIRLTDGSLVTVSHATIAADTLALSLADTPALKVTLPLARVVGIEQINGPVSWLSSRTPIENIQTPYFGGAPQWPALMDATVDGSPLICDGRRIDHGIGVHSYSRLSFAIEPGWTTFRTQYAIDSRSDSPRPLADVTVRVKLDGKVAYEKTHVRAGSPTPVIQLDLAGAKTLTLESDYGDGGDTQDHLNWIEPALLRAASPTTIP